MLFFSRLYRRFQGKSRMLGLGSAGFILACSLAAAKAAVRDDITSLMPTSPPELAEQFAVLREAPLAQGLTITVGGGDPARAAAILADRLRGPEIPNVIAGDSTAFSPSLLTKICAASPNLMDREAMAALPEYLNEDAMARSLRRDMSVLLTPKGLALRELLAMDPLGICGGAMKRIAPEAQGYGPKLGGGAMLSGDGRHALVLAEPAASLADSGAAKAVMDRVREAIRVLPQDTEVMVVGGHRHTEENTAVIQNDLRRILPASIILLAAAFLIFVRTRQGLAIVLLPGAALAVAAAFTAVFYGAVSGIVMGFGSVVLGITADYAIHVYYAVRSGKDTPDSLRRVSGPLLFGALTTLAAFAAFFSSSIPCIVQMTSFAICGVLTAVFLALAVLPHYLTPAGAYASPGNAPDGNALGRIPARPRKRVLAVLWLGLGLALAALLADVPVNGDVRALSYASKSIAKDEARTREIWGGLSERAMIAVRGGTLEQALEKNDALWVALKNSDQADISTRGILSLAPLLPSQATQRARQTAWKNFWAERGPDALDRLERLAASSGFSPQAFLPFRRWITSEPPMIGPDFFTEAGLTLPLTLIRDSGNGHLVYSLAPAGLRAPGFDAMLRAHDAAYVSGQTFRDALSAATRTDLLRFGGLSLAAILGMSAWVLRSPARMGLTLLPVASGLVCVLGVFRLTGMSLNIFHAMALPLVMALSVDYGIFMLSRQEGTLGGESRMGVLLSGITTLSGFGVLLLADHPALFSLGLTVSLGLVAALLAALVLLPLLVRPAKEKEGQHVYA